MNTKSYIFIFLFTFVFINLSKSQDVINVNNDLSSIPIGDKLYFYIDNDKNLTLNDVINDKFQENFIKSEKSVPFFDYISSTIWLKFTVKNNSNTYDNFFLLIDYPLLYKINIYMSHTLKTG